MHRRTPLGFSRKRKGKKTKKPYPIFPKSPQRLFSSLGSITTCPHCGATLSAQNRAWLARKGQTKCSHCKKKITSGAGTPTLKKVAPTTPTQPPGGCPECGSKKLIPDHQTGELICADCGFILTFGKGKSVHPVKEEKPAPPPKMPSKITIENYYQVPVPAHGEIGKKYAPLIKWGDIEQRYLPPPPGKIEYLDYPMDDAPQGLMKELRDAFRRNREYVSQGKDPVNVMLHGPAGVGKTIGVREFAEEVQLPYYYVPAEPAAMTSEQLLGRREIVVRTDPKTGQMLHETVWRDGTIIKAATTGGILHIDEFSLFRP